MTCKVMEACEGEHRSYILVYEMNHIPKKGEMCVIKSSGSQGLELVSWMKGVVKHYSSWP